VRFGLLLTTFVRTLRLVHFVHEIAPIAIGAKFAKRSRKFVFLLVLSGCHPHCRYSLPQSRTAYLFLLFALCIFLLNLSLSLHRLCQVFLPQASFRENPGRSPPAPNTQHPATSPSSSQPQSQPFLHRLCQVFLPQASLRENPGRSHPAPNTQHPATSPSSSQPQSQPFPSQTLPGFPATGILSGKLWQVSPSTQYPAPSNFPFFFSNLNLSLPFTDSARFSCHRHPFGKTLAGLTQYPVPSTQQLPLLLLKPQSQPSLHRLCQVFLPQASFRENPGRSHPAPSNFPFFFSTSISAFPFTDSARFSCHRHPFGKTLAGLTQYPATSPSSSQTSISAFPSQTLPGFPNSGRSLPVS